PFIGSLLMILNGELLKEGITNMSMYCGEITLELCFQDITIKCEAASSPSSETVFNSSLNCTTVKINAGDAETSFLEDTKNLSRYKIKIIVKSTNAS
ncbi:hypothetical protein BgiBS90_019155, partial [Biomphalaria glabrata]